jgi:hypothetical protein
MAQNSIAYDEDFYAWTVEQARLLRSGDLTAVDIANVAEEIESMGRKAIGVHWRAVWPCCSRTF